MKKNILNNIEAIIFDMDGSLVDSMWMWKSIDIEFFSMFNIEFPDNLQKNIEGMSFTQTAMYFKEHFDFQISIEEMIDIWNKMAYEKYSKSVDFKNGALQFLKYCKSKNIKLGIATSNSRFLFDAVRNHLKLDEYFECMLTGSEITNGKPAPDMYLAVANKLGVEPSKCLVFEDIIPGIMAGHNAGMKVCAVYDDYSISDDVKKKDMAEYYINDYTDILNIIS